jgi:antibiotic biosynthesis monooxygenase (ABM) superfamily enzyme
MILYVQKYDIIPDKAEAYNEWAKTAIRRILAAPGVVEFRGYRPLSGTSQATVTIEFADLDAFAAFYADENMQQVLAERHAYEINITTELWGTSPVVPEPLRPDG